jgi:hypothetical protein
VNAIYLSSFSIIAGKETRAITILKNSDTGLPASQYAFIDLYCTDLDCDHHGPKKQ